MSHEVKSGFEFRAVTMREVADMGNWASFVGGYVTFSEAMADFKVYEDADKDFGVRLALLPDYCSTGEELDHSRTQWKPQGCTPARK